MISKKLKINFLKNFLILLFFFSISFTTSFQTFKYFELEDAIDPKSYVQMSRGEYNVNPTHKYRFVIPKTVELIRPIISKIDLPLYYEGKENEITNEDKIKNDKLLFFLVNLTITSLTAYFTYCFIKDLGLGKFNSLIGGSLFLSIRYIVLSTSIPIVDSLQYFAVILYSIFLLNNQTIKLSLVLPLMIISKETMIPLIFLPLINSSLNRKFIILSILISILFLIFVRQQIYSPSDQLSINLLENIMIHFDKSFERLINLFSIKGFVKLFSGYGVILFFAILGYIDNLKRKDFYFPLKIKFLVPYSLFLCLLSNDSGRMFTISFPVVIPYSLYFINTRLLNIKKYDF